MAKGNLIIISAPSGAGKTSLVKQLISELDAITVSISHTTRKQRPGEVDGVDYYFIEPQEFRRMHEHDDFLEQATVFDYNYGTSRQSVFAQLDSGIDVILEIDWQGAQQIRKKYPSSCSIFILPPSIGVLEQRLRSRGQDSEQVIQRRMDEAVAEMRHYPEYDYLIVNDNFDRALTELKAVIQSKRLRRECQVVNLDRLLADLITA